MTACSSDRKWHDVPVPAWPVTSQSERRYPRICCSLIPLGSEKHAGRQSRSLDGLIPVSNIRDLGGEWCKCILFYSHFLFWERISHSKHMRNTATIAVTHITVGFHINQIHSLLLQTDGHSLLQIIRSLYFLAEIVHSDTQTKLKFRATA